MRNFPNVFCSFSPGMPIINGIPGSFLEAIKKILINGTDKASYTSITVQDGKAYVTALADYQVFFNGSTINIEGCNEPLLNGFKTIEGHSKYNFWFTTTAADGAYDGAIKINQPPCGWEILYSGTNEAVIISSNLDTLGVCIKIKDTNSTYAEVEIYESMSSLTVGVNKFNPSFFASNRVFRIVKSGTANSSAMNWWLIADNTSVHLSIDRKNNVNNNFSYYFGDYVISFGQCNSLDKAYSKNFYYLQTQTRNSDSEGYYDLTGSIVGICYPNSYWTNIDRYTGCFISNNNFQNWKLSTLNCGLGGSPGNWTLSGSRNNFNFYEDIPVETLVTPHILLTTEVYTAGAAIPTGIIKEALFIATNQYGNKEKFSLEVINGKKYILLPLNVKGWADSPGTTYNGENLGLVAFLLDSKWE